MPEVLLVTSGLFSSAVRTPLPRERAHTYHCPGVLQGTGILSDLGRRVKLWRAVRGAISVVYWEPAAHTNSLVESRCFTFDVGVDISVP
jgi:hypothetical protein